MFVLTNLIGFGTGGGYPPSLTFLQGSMSNTDATTYTFSGQNLGAADTNRWIIVCVSGVTNVARSISSVTVGGVSATKLVQSEGSSVYRHNSIWAAHVPTGTTGDIVVTWSSGLLRCGYSAYSLTSVNAATTPFDTQSDNTLSGSDLSVSISSGTNGVVVASTTGVGSTAQSFTWSGATEDYDATWSESTNQGLSSASTTPTSTPTTITVTAASTLANSHAMCAASFT